MDRNEISSDFFYLTNGTQCRLLLKDITVDEINSLFIYLKYSSLPLFAHTDLHLIYSLGQRSMQKEEVDFLLDDIIASDECTSEGAIVGMVFLSS
jgi:hypothetical protein